MNEEDENEPDSALYHEVRPPVWKNYLYQLQLRAPKPIRVRCENSVLYKPPYYGKEFHGSLSREEADRLVSAQEGCYLVRESRSSPGSYALSMRFGVGTKNFRLYYDGMHYVAEKRFETLNDLVEDGLIAMYLESIAKDYIDTMMFDAPGAKNNGPTVPPKQVSTSDEQTRKEEKEGRRMSFDKRQSVKASAYAKEHNFKVHTYKGFYWCDYCKNFLWGIKQQGLKCQDCGYNVHKQCINSLRGMGDCQPDRKLIKRVFGVDLTTLVKAYDTKLPHIVEQCANEVEKRGLNVEGIYRVSGFADDIEHLKTLYDKGDQIDLAAFDDINIIAGLLKLYFRLLPLPVITFETYHLFVDAVKLEEAQKIAAIGSALSKLPDAHYATLKYLIAHLNRVTNNQTENMMTSENLSIVFGPTLMRFPDQRNPMHSLDLIKFQKLAVQCLIDESHTLFDV